MHRRQRLLPTQLTVVLCASPGNCVPCASQLNGTRATLKEMQLIQLILLVATISWLAAAIGLVALYRRQLTCLKFVFAVIFCTFGSASASYYVLSRAFEIERHSASHLVSVTHLRLSDDVAFLDSELGPTLELAASDQGQNLAFNWTGTFETKHQDILRALDDVIQNDCIQRYYSVWAADVAFEKTQLDMLASKVIALTEPGARRITFDTYADKTESTRQLLDSLATEMRTPIPSEFYGTGY